MNDRGLVHLWDKVRCCWFSPVVSGKREGFLSLTAGRAGAIFSALEAGELYCTQVLDLPSWLNGKDL
ncbi:hypothetical protein, unlikely [Trypanosoma brucei brucei TREU927]|uniref:Uncharacterized protein n=1 Tax=Trypanosoma brucei brucei (strain 927/4 GUTat10.1) TaxID=185431 RepID=Q38FL9_TRYB2|nr:hypothetical protein, unlikely [Trypanosoma brucei brucei TREU927]EAN76401.1 hypothetical protein, unlikely [Trypanosoma brucei brucei TREU927]